MISNNGDKGSRSQGGERKGEKGGRQTDIERKGMEGGTMCT
jgi:hypothetical protein